jgi:carbon-monoxide dehydrogenase medium subunit
MDIALVNAAATVSLDGQGRIERAALALGAVGRTAFAVSGLDEELRGQTPTDRVLRGAEVLAREAARPIDDVRASAEYRREMVGVLAGRALREAVRAAVENGAE